MSWRGVTYRLPAEPSRHRGAIWRELRRLGAGPLQQGTWALPQGGPFDAGVAHVAAAIIPGGGQAVLLAPAAYPARGSPRPVPGPGPGAPSAVRSPRHGDPAWLTRPQLPRRRPPGSLTPRPPA